MNNYRVISKQSPNGPVYDVTEFEGDSDIGYGCAATFAMEMAGKGYHVILCKVMKVYTQTKYK